MSNILDFKRVVELEVASCGNCECEEYYLCMNGEIYCVECRQLASNIKWIEVEPHAT